MHLHWQLFLGSRQLLTGTATIQVAMLVVDSEQQPPFLFADQPEEESKTVSLTILYLEKFMLELLFYLPLYAAPLLVFARQTD